ncbi:MAG: hypothetical protein FJ138_16700, partial [Deltaproteobacteria bacterium]|nr:hypothetical protein [Deltaproteobacteria bacterium]
MSPALSPRPLSGADAPREAYIAPRHAAWGLALLAYAVALCGVRLFDLLAYEFAFACCLPVSLCAAHEGVAAWREGRALLFSERGVWGAWARACRPALALALLPLLPITLNALRVRNCDWLEGLACYAALPLTTAVIAAGWGVACGAAGRGLGAFGGLFALTALYALGQVWLTPIIDPFHPFMGYYPGALYDEELAVGARLLWSRVEDAAWVSLALSLLSLLAHPDPLGRRLAALACAAGLLSARAVGADLDLHRDDAHVARALGGRAQSAHFEVFYPRGWSEARAWALTQELEFSYQELEAFFGRPLSRIARAYLYDSAAQKKRLMGASYTRVAKPWQYALHVQGADVGDDVIAHELTHVFSADLAPAPHHLSLYRGLIPHMPLIEGLAVAATWSRGPLTPHQWSAALTQEGAAPPLGEVLNPGGFYLRGSSVSYTLCGSFVRFFREREGREALAALYASGGEVPGGPERLGALVRDWEEHLKATPLSPKERAYAAGALSAPSIFHKVCAHEVAEARGDARDAEARGDWEAARAAWARVEGFTAPPPGALGGDPEAAFGQTQALYALGRLDAARALLGESPALKAAGLPPHVTLRAREWALDVEARALLARDAWGEDAARLAREYATLLDEHPARSRQRPLAVKHSALALTPPGAPAARLTLSVLLGAAQAAGGEAGEAGEAARRLEEASAAQPAWWAPLYLRGRLALAADPAQGRALLGEALKRDLPHPSLTLEARRAVAMSVFEGARDRAGYEEASALFDALAAQGGLGLSEAEGDDLRRWARRARFFASAPPPPPPAAPAPA